MSEGTCIMTDIFKRVQEKTMSLTFCLCVWMLNVVFINTAVPCGYTASDRRGEITSPGYPKMYAENLDCEWKIYVGETETITIQFLDLYIDYSYYRTMGCRDYLLIFDGPSSESHRILGRCGVQLPDPIVSSSNVVTIVFQTNSIYSARGFHLKWRVTDSFTLHTQSVSWQEAEELCALDGAVLAIYSDAASPTLTKKIENINGRVWIDKYSKESSAESSLCYTVEHDENQLKVEAEESCLTELSFICQKEAVICGENITASNGNISSPNYPESYFNDLFCVWEVSVFKDYTIVLDFLSVDTENSTDCLYDYIEIVDISKSSSKVLQRICGQTSNLTVVTSSKIVAIRFRSDGNNNGSGFLMEWHSELITTTASTPQSTLTSVTTREISFSYQRTTYSVKFHVDSENVTERSSTFEAATLAGIVIGGVIFAVIVACIAILTCIRYKRKKVKTQLETSISLNTCKEANREEPTSTINLQDLYSVPVPKEFRQQRDPSSVDQNSFRPDSDCNYDTYNHLHGHPNSDNVQNVYGKLRTVTDSYNQTKQSTSAMQIEIGNTYAHLDTMTDIRNEQEEHRSLNSSETQGKLCVMEPDYDNRGSEVLKSSAYPQNTYDHLSDLGTNIAADSEYGYAKNLKTPVPVNNYERNALNEGDDFDEETYYNISST